MVKATLDFTVPVIDVDQLLTEKDNFILLDAREYEEYKVSHIKGAIHIGYEELKLDKLQKLDKSQPIALYCSIGYRSEKVAEKLLAMGFTNVKNVYGSVFEWANRGYDLVDTSGKSVRAIHGYSPAWGIWIKRKNITILYKPD